MIAREDPAIPVIDLTHGIERQDIRAGKGVSIEELKARAKKEAFGQR